MIFECSRLEGVYIIRLEPAYDNRGFFARTFCVRELVSRGLNAEVAQASIAYNRKKGTIRGLHFQKGAEAETKLIRCIRGRLLDVVVDVREKSRTYLEHIGIELNSENRLTLYVPPGFAHGYQTLCDDTEVFYQMDKQFDNNAQAGLRYSDPKLDIEWPLPVTEISKKDRTWPLLEGGE